MMLWGEAWPPCGVEAPGSKSIVSADSPNYLSKATAKGTMHVDLSSSTFISGKVPGGNPTTELFTSHDRSTEFQ